MRKSRGVAAAEEICYSGCMESGKGVSLKKEQRLTHDLFLASIAIKGFDGILEVLGSFLFFATGSVTRIVALLVQGELGEDPHDFVANKISELLPYFSTHSQTFIAWYLLIHGIVKIVLVIALLRRVLVAYPLSIAVLFLFMAYQAYRYAGTGSVFLLILTAFDALVVVLIWREYRNIRSAGGAAAARIPG